MLTQIHPKLPMRSKVATKHFYINSLGFKDIGKIDYDGYLMLKKDEIEIHFFEFEDLNPAENYGQIYIRCTEINEFYNFAKNNKITIAENGKIEDKPWNQREFSILDPDNNLLTFGQNLL